jgi:hypothetical protein
MPDFAKSVFVNCPFDRDYLNLFQAIIFTIQCLRLEARTSYEVSDAGQPRIAKLVGLIRSSKFGIHDLSRCKAKKAGEFARMNMPLELGIDYGCKQYGSYAQRGKKLLILDTKRYRLQKVASDLAGSDIAAHSDKQLEAIRLVSHWLHQEAGAPLLPATEIRANYEDFMDANYRRLREQGFSTRDIDRLPADVLRRAMQRWLASDRRLRDSEFRVTAPDRLHRIAPRRADLPRTRRRRHRVRRPSGRR